MKILLIFLTLFFANMVHGQYSFRSASGNSGIVVGSNDASKFTGINYDLSSSKLGLSFRQTKQNLSNERIKNDKEGYSDLIGHNVYLGIAINNSKATLVKNSKWQGNIEAAYDFSYTWDNTPLPNGTVGSGTTTKNLYFSTADRNPTPELFTTKRACESKWGENTCNSPPIAGAVTYFNTDDYEDRNLLNQSTLFFRISGSIAPLNLAHLDNDTTVILTSSQVSVIPRVALGFNQRLINTKHPNTLFTIAPSFSYYFIPKSTGLHKEFLFDDIKKIYNVGLVNQMNGTSSKTYFLGGTPEFEGVFNPRLDIVTSIRMGDNKPYINFIGAYSPNLSTFKTIGWKQNYAIGIGLTLPLVPDQMLFAILYEGLAFNKNDSSKEQSLTFYASVPFSFK